MATENSLKCVTVPPAADLSAKQYYLCKIDGSGKVALAGAITDIVFPLQNKPKTSGAEYASIGLNGVSKVVAGGVIAAGDRVSPMVGGKAEVAGNGHRPFGIALEAAGADGDIIAVLLTPGEVL